MWKIGNPHVSSIVSFKAPPDNTKSQALNEKFFIQTWQLSLSSLLGALPHHATHFLGTANLNPNAKEFLYC